MAPAGWTMCECEADKAWTCDYFNYFSDLATSTSVFKQCVSCIVKFQCSFCSFLTPAGLDSL